MNSSFTNMQTLYPPIGLRLLPRYMTLKTEQIWSEGRGVAVQYGRKEVHGVDLEKGEGGSGEGGFGLRKERRSAAAFVSGLYNGAK